jgi:hypothetical protein
MRALTPTPPFLLLPTTLPIFILLRPLLCPRLLLRRLNLIRLLKKLPPSFQIPIRLQQFLHTTELFRVMSKCEIEIVDFEFLAAGVAGVRFGFVADFYDVAVILILVEGLEGKGG